MIYGTTVQYRRIGENKRLQTIIVILSRELREFLYRKYTEKRYI